MNSEQLNAIKERAEKATPGPWEVCNGTDVFTKLGAVNKDEVKANHNDGWYIAKCNEGSTTVGDEEVEMTFNEQSANAQLVAHARQDIPQLVAEVERLRSALESLQDDLITTRGLNATHDNEITGMTIRISKVLAGGDYDE